MKISEVEAILMSYRLPAPLRLPFWGGERTIIKRDAMLIRIKADNGLIGYAPGPAHERAAEEIRNVICPFLLGRDPRDWNDVEFIGSPNITKTYRAVEIALIDLAARFEGVAVSELLGGRKRDRIKLYGSAGMYMSPSGYAEEAAAISQMGFAAYKMRPALGPEQDLHTLRLMRKAVGQDFGLMIDAHSWWRMGDRSYSFETIAELAGAIAKFHPTWLEEPLPPDDHAAYRKLRAMRTIPIASGEHEPDEAGFHDLIDLGGADYIQMDVCCQGRFYHGPAHLRRGCGTGVALCLSQLGHCAGVARCSPAWDLLAGGCSRVAGIPVLFQLWPPRLRGRSLLRVVCGWHYSTAKARHVSLSAGR